MWVTSGFVAKERDKSEFDFSYFIFVRYYSVVILDETVSHEAQLPLVFTRKLVKQIQGLNCYDTCKTT